MTELDHLAQQAAALDAEAAAATGAAPDPSAEPATPEPAPADPGRELAAIFEAMRAIALARGFRRTAAALDDESVAAMVAALLPVLDKYGITPSGLFGKWGPEIGALLVCGPLVWALFVALRSDLEERAAAAAKPVNAEPAPAPDAGKQPG